VTRAFSGRDADEVTLDAVRRGDVSMDDVRIHPDTLHRQADVAEAHGNVQLAENFRRAAELTALTEEEVLRVYEALRPRRSSPEELDALAAWLEERGAARNAALVREARDVYVRRDLVR